MERMLTLERKEGETITITHNGEAIDVIVSMAKNGKVKLSFDGPQSFSIERDDIRESAQ